MKILKWLNLLDKQNHLSLTNFALFLCFVRLSIPKDLSLADAAIFLVAVASYTYKRFSDNKMQTLQNTLKKEISELHHLNDQNQSAIVNVENQLALFKVTQEQIKKSAEDIQKVISTKNLTNALYTRSKRETTS